ncbi:hypothetical protein LCGC14_1748800 [marine sediment metagenome]|uniref:Uncharacterized protein n=1 Tax=marine sediment metagenome TaxID=412755 RepID=A0A0F9H4J9_9ZZZZ
MGESMVKKRKSKPIKGCYAWTLVEEMWDKMTFTQRWNEISSISYSEDILVKWAHSPWVNLDKVKKGRVVGVLKGKTHIFANNKFYGVKAADRRVILCPDSFHYGVLKERSK